MPYVATETLGDRITASMKRKGLRNLDVAEALGVHPGTVSKWRNDSQPPEPGLLDQLAEIANVDAAWLRYGTRTFNQSAIGAETRQTSPKLPPKAYERVYTYLERMRASKIPDDMVDEAERLMSVPVFSKLNKRDVRERSDEDLITDIDAAWSWIREVVQREWGIDL